MLSSHGDTSRRGRLRRHGSRGTASVEYGLLVALIGAILCLGIGATLNTMFNDTVQCLLGHLPGQTLPASCNDGPRVSEPPGPGEPGGPGGPPLPTASPCPTDPAKYDPDTADPSCPVPTPSP